MLLLAYGLGAATSLAVALLIGGRVFTAMKRSLGAGEWIRRGLGVAVLAGVVAIALSAADTGFLARISLASTGKLEQSLTDRLAPAACCERQQRGYAAPLAGATLWLNSPPLSAAGSEGARSCWSISGPIPASTACARCLISAPGLRNIRIRGWWSSACTRRNSPSRRIRRRCRRCARPGRHYPVALDNDFTIWKSFDNQYWPAHYFIDAKGVIRHHISARVAMQVEQEIRQL